MILSLVIATVISQPAVEPVAAPAAAPTSESIALEKLGVAAERLAAAAERLSPPPVAPSPDAAPPKPDLWTGSAGVGLTWVTGNVTSIAFVASGQATRKGEHTITVLKAFGGYGEKLNDSGTGSEVLLLNAGLAGQFDYRFTKNVSAFFGAGIDTDHVKSVEIRGYGDLGVGVLWLDIKEGEVGKEFQKLYLKTDLGLRVQPEQRFQYYPVEKDVPNALMIGPRLALSFRYALSSAAYFTEDAEVLPNVLPNQPGRVLFNSVSKLGVGIAASMSLSAGFTVKYDSAPADGRKNTDTVLSVGLDANF
jgi:hypothetical protein